MFLFLKLLDHLIVEYLYIVVVDGLYCVLHNVVYSDSDTLRNPKKATKMAVHIIILSSNNLEELNSFVLMKCSMFEVIGAFFSFFIIFILLNSFDPT